MIVVMISVSLALSIPASAQTAPASAPSAAALALARAADDHPVSPVDLNGIAGPIAQNLLYTTSAARGFSCEPSLPACRSAAEQLAIEAAPALVASRREQRTQIVAMIIDDTMTPPEIDRAAAFVGTPAGKGLVKSLSLAGDLRAMRPELRAKIAEVMMRGVPDPMGALFDRFYTATKALPRRSIPLVPPPPTISARRQK